MNLIVKYVVQTCGTWIESNSSSTFTQKKKKKKKKVQAQCASQLLLLQNKIMVDYIGI